MLLSQARSEFIDTRCRMLANALQNVDQVVVGVDLVQAAGGEQALYDTDVFGAELCPGEQPVSRAHGYHT